MTLQQTIEKFRRVDATRADYPGEHLAVLGAGVLLLLAAGRSRSFLMRIAAGAAGGALIGRAIDTRGERTTGTVLGAAAGALLGRHVERNRKVRCR